MTPVSYVSLQTFQLKSMTRILGPLKKLSWLKAAFQDSVIASGYHVQTPSVQEKRPKGHVVSSNWGSGLGAVGRVPMATAKHGQWDFRKDGVTKGTCGSRLTLRFCMNNQY